MKLNDRQQEVVDHGEGPMMVLAGAGSGKTRAIVHRIADLIETRGVHPERILAVTFTNKAAGEMRERVEAMLGADHASPTWVSTFHSACARLLRKEAPRLGLPRSFTILDDDDQKRMLRTVATSMQREADAQAISKYRQFIEGARNAGWLPEKAWQVAVGRVQESYCEIYEAYHKRMRASGTLDFGDLILAVIELFEGDERVRGQYQFRFQHLLVDEFQDTNPAQYRLLRLLCGEARNIVVVGDDDQSIYAWRGATVDNLLGFTDDYPDAHVVRLEQNYRSTQPILDLANAVISRNRGRHPKQLWTERAEGPKPTLFVAATDREEAEYVAREIRGLRREGARLDEIAVFYRTNAQSRIYEECLRRFDLGYRVFAGTSFYDREEIRDVLAYLRVAVNPLDGVAAARIANVPRRGCGAKTLERAEEVSQAESLPLIEALAEMGRRGDGVRRSAAKGVIQLAETMREATLSAERDLPSTLTRWLLEAVGYRAHLDAVHPDDAEDRWENVVELSNAMAAYEAECARAGVDARLLGFLERTALVQMTDVEENDGVVSLMTIHAAKGLEFPYVFLTGLEDGSMPLQRGPDRRVENPEEERRLCYVAMTRAKDKLYLSRARQRMLFGKVRRCDPSPFITDLDKSLLAQDPRSAGQAASDRVSYPIQMARQGYRAQQSSLDFVDQRHYPEPEDIPQYVEPAAGSPGDPTVVYDHIPAGGLKMTRPSRDTSALDATYVGRWVRHKTFGEGKVTAAEMASGKTKLTIRFGAGVKKVMAQFVELM